MKNEMSTSITGRTVDLTQKSKYNTNMFKCSEEKVKK